MVFIQLLMKYNPNKKHKILIVLNDLIADVLSHRKLQPTVAEMVVYKRFLDISLVFIKQSFFAVKNISSLFSHLSERQKTIF